jgi:hypothetical protein
MQHPLVQSMRKILLMWLTGVGIACKTCARGWFRIVLAKFDTFEIDFGTHANDSGTINE